MKINLLTKRGKVEYWLFIITPRLYFHSLWIKRVVARVKPAPKWATNRLLLYFRLKKLSEPVTDYSELAAMGGYMLMQDTILEGLSSKLAILKIVMIEQ